MYVKRTSSNCLLAVLVVVGGSAVAMGQTDSASPIYGRGVHAYFAGRMDDAIGDFNSAIALGTRDPRVYYFRGLAFHCQGREFEAEADFEQAAHLEYQGITTVNVGRALERIQGHRRMQLEKVRRRTHALLAQQRVQDSPPIPMVPAKPDGDPQRLRTPVHGGTDTIEPVKDAPESDTDPFGEEGDTSTDAERVEPVAPKEVPVDVAAPKKGDEVNPFEDDSSFGDSAPAAGSPFDDTTPSPAEESPFDADAAGEGSPFDAADEGAAKESGPEKPAADAEPAKGDGGTPAEVDNPLGGDEDPFG